MTGRRTAPTTALEQVERVVREIHFGLEQQVLSVPDELVVDDACELLRDTVNAYQRGAGDDAASAVYLLATQYNRAIGRLFNKPGQSLTTLAGLATAFANLSAVLTPFDGQADLDDARTDLADLEAELTGQLAALEEAIGRADVDAVMRIRGQVEVGLPARIEQARIKVLDLQIARSTAEQQQPAERLTALSAATKSAAEELVGAQHALDAATSAHQAAHAAETGTRNAIQASARQHSELTAQRDQLQAQHQNDQAARLRRLAGLPDPIPVQDDDEITVVTPTSMFGGTVDPDAARAIETAGRHYSDIDWSAVTGTNDDTLIDETV